MARLVEAFHIAADEAIAERNTRLMGNSCEEVDIDKLIGWTPKEWSPDFSTGGYRIRSIPAHNRQPAVLSVPDSKYYDRTADAEASEIIAQHDGPTGKRGTFDFEKLIERCRRKTLTRIRAEPSWFARLCAAHDALPALPALDRNAGARADEAMQWIIEVEGDPALERARQIVLCWLRSGQPQRAFAASKGLHRTELRRLIDSYCSTVADRLKTAPASAAIRLAANDCPTAERKGERRTWRPALSVDQRVYSNAQTVVRGVDEIAAVTRRKPASALRLIEGGKAPIATLAGQPVAIRELLDTSRWRSTAKAQIAA
ncbi:MAG: hypothetical protein WB715_11370 [Roseiarcus sp.]|uniref:hypothetical protein n=1 Tax=Roseiarcus sp. TaxID=1969460 RepID=UPI003C3284C2